MEYLKKVEVVPTYKQRCLSLENALLAQGMSCEVYKAQGYYVESRDEIAVSLLQKTLVDEAKEEFVDCAQRGPQDYRIVAEVGFMPGVTDNVAKSCESALALEVDQEIKCYSFKTYYLHCDSEFDDHKYRDCFLELYNPLIETIKFYRAGEDRFSHNTVPKVIIDHKTDTKVIRLDLSDEELMKMSDDMCLALNIDEMKTIKSFYESDECQKLRSECGLPLYPTDVELEVLAQTWSEHCKHKIFAADINYTDHVNGQSRNIKSLYKSYIKKATKECNNDFLISVFSDNAGIVRFDNNVDVCIKAETHNSPSALDPYGGALTGILGVNRDILGCGLGAKPIANTNVFCVGELDLDKRLSDGELPSGLLTPKDILSGIHAGVRDGGNKSGIPTVNGAMVFDDCYGGKPLVFCGTVGVMPAKLADGREGKEKGAKPGDYVYVAGGSVGADGIHGATFSSLDLNENSPATAVQIGDPITQKRLMNFLLEARDLGLFTCVTDNGAGGISSSIGEMATLTGGARIDLAQHPTKYPGLAPWEIMISESQERMTFAVDESKSDEFEALAAKRNVMVANLGQFTDSKYLDVFYKDQRVAYLDMDFLHDGLPTMELEAHYRGELTDDNWSGREAKSFDSVESALKTILHNENVASKRQWVEQYDHEVQGATQVKPFVGREQRSPGNSGVVSLEVHGGEKNSAVAIGCGLNPRFSRIDAKLMAQLSVDEAVRNIIGTGANPEKICLLDNFCWPDPVQSQKTKDGHEKLGQLVRSCEGLFEICTLYGTPLVSGKDSMKNDFRGKRHNGEDLKISIKPTLLVTSMGHCHQEHVVTSTLTDNHANLYIVGADQRLIKGSTFEYIYGEAMSEPQVNFDFQKCLDTYQAYYQLVQSDLISSCHDISEGGLLTCLSEKTFDVAVDVTINLVEKDSVVRALFGEGPGQFIVSVEQDKVDAFEKQISQLKVEWNNIGTVSKRGTGQINVEVGQETYQFKSSDLLGYWERKWF